MHDTIKATQNTTQLFKNNMSVETARYTVQIRRITANERRSAIENQTRKCLEKKRNCIIQTVMSSFSGWEYNSGTFWLLLCWTSSVSLVVSVVFHQLRDGFPGVSLRICSVGVLTGFFLRTLLSTPSTKDVLVVIEVPVLVFIKMSFHFVVFSSFQGFTVDFGLFLEVCWDCLQLIELSYTSPLTQKWNLENNFP